MHRIGLDAGHLEIHPDTDGLADFHRLRQLLFGQGWISEVGCPKANHTSVRRYGDIAGAALSCNERVG